MIDVEAVDKMFEASRKFGCRMEFGIFDKRILLPLSTLAFGVGGELGENVSVEELQRKAYEGWFPLLPGAGGNIDELGAPLYVPSRVGLLFKLFREGYSPEELLEYAKFEEWFVDNVLTEDEWQYRDDDLDTLVAYCQRRIEAFDDSCANGFPGGPQEAADVERLRSKLDSFRRWQHEGVPPAKAEIVARLAYRVRAHDEAIRVMLLDHERAVVRSGYSHTVSFTGATYFLDGSFTPGPIVWDSTVRSAIAHADGCRDPDSGSGLPPSWRKGDEHAHAAARRIRQALEGARSRAVSFDLGNSKRRKALRELLHQPSEGRDDA